jgi:hypothetical protein
MMDDQARGSFHLGKSDDPLLVVMCFHCGSCNFAAHHFCRDCGQPLGARYVDLALARLEADPWLRFSIPDWLRGPLQLFLMGLAISILLAILVVMIITFAHGGPIS